MVLEAFWNHQPGFHCFWACFVLMGLLQWLDKGCGRDRQGERERERDKVPPSRPASFLSDFYKVQSLGYRVYRVVLTCQVQSQQRCTRCYCGDQMQLLGCCVHKPTKVDTFSFTVGDTADGQNPA